MTLIAGMIYGGGMAYAYGAYRAGGDGRVAAILWAATWPVSIGAALAAKVIR